MRGLAFAAAEHRYANGRGVGPTSLRFEAGEVTALVGRSGSGKSTLLAMAALVLPPQQGDVLIDGRPTAGLSEAHRDDLRRHDLRFVWQDNALIGYLNAWENVAAQLGPDLSRHRSEALAALQAVGLDGKGTSSPATLSGGERQRVAVARGLMGHPSVVLADEPTGNLDRESAALVLDCLRDLAGQNKAVVIATHDDAVLDYADHRYELEQP